MWEQIEMLKNHTNLAANAANFPLRQIKRLALRRLHQLLAFDDDFARADFFQIVYRAQQSAFTRAGRADDSHGFALVDVQRHIIQSLQVAKSFAYVVKFQ